MKDTRLVHGLVRKAVEIHERVIELRAKLLARTLSAQCARARRSNFGGFMAALFIDMEIIYNGSL